jgi:membrane protein DedA with SNARE-associated domain
VTAYLLNLLEELGPVGIFVLMIPESACLPIPSELTLMFGGYLVHQHAVGFALAVAAGTAGNLVGSLIAYGAGRAGALRGLDRGPARAAVARCEALFRRRGDATVLWARLMPLARTFVSLPAGHARVPLPRFVAMTVVGCAAWSAAFVGAGLAAGSAWADASSMASKALLAATVAGLAYAALRGPEISGSA